MKIVYISLLSLIGMTTGLDAAPKQIQFKNGSKKIKLQVQSQNIDKKTGINSFNTIMGQPEYVIEPNEPKDIKILNGPGAYTFVITFIGLERGGFATLLVDIKPDTTKYVIDNAWEVGQYDYFAAYIKQMDTPAPEVSGGGSW